MLSTRSKLAGGLMDRMHMMCQASSIVGAKSLVPDTTLQKAVAIPAKEDSTPCLERVLTVRTVTQATNDVASTVAESVSDITDHML